MDIELVHELPILIFAALAGIALVLFAGGMAWATVIKAKGKVKNQELAYQSRLEKYEHLNGKFPINKVNNFKP